MELYCGAMPKDHGIKKIWSVSLGFEFILLYPKRYLNPSTLRVNNTFVTAVLWNA